MIAGLLLTLCLDGFLYTSHRQNEGEVYTPYAIHRLEGIDGMVKWWNVVTKIMASSWRPIRLSYLVHPREPAMVMAMNPMIRSIQILPEKENRWCLQRKIREKWIFLASWKVP